MKKAVKKSKVNGLNYIQQQQLERRVQDKEMRLHTMQYTLDMVVVTLGRMGFGEKRLKEFQQKYYEVAIEYADEIVEDSKSDADIVYTKDCLDRELKQYLCKSFAPYEERYTEARRDNAST